MKLVLTRYGSSPMGTFGELEFDGQRCFTVERPWLDNKPTVSCVPPGVYTLERHSSNKYPNTFALVNDSLGVTHYKEGWSKRYGILIHAGNVSSDLMGCIAPGERLGALNGDWAVLGSKSALSRIRKALGNEERHALYIAWQKHYGRVEDGPIGA